MTINTAYLSSLPRANGDWSAIEQYQEVFQAMGIEYAHTGSHLGIGALTQAHTIELYLSVVISQVSGMLISIAPVLRSPDCVFRVVSDVQLAKSVLNGEYGPAMLGKVATFYFSDPAVALEIASQLRDLTSLFHGPRIPGAWPLNEAVYAPASCVQNFGSLCRPPSASGEILQGKYKPLTTLKEDPKGNVILAKYLKGLMKVGTCVIKQGKKAMWSDPWGRDMAHRLEWQKQVHEKLAGIVRVPQVFELFFEDQDAYLSMEYIPGESLSATTARIYNGRSWEQLARAEKLVILDDLLRVAGVLRKLHASGFIHRDFTPANFLILEHSKEREICLIDLEMLYDKTSAAPRPAFRGGTKGFMSSNQLEHGHPEFEDDIFAFGGLMITLLTNIAPQKFSISSPTELFKSLFFFINDPLLCRLITSCMEAAASKRPALDVLIQGMERFRDSVLREAGPDTFHPFTPAPGELRGLIDRAVNGLLLADHAQTEAMFGISAQADYRITDFQNTVSPGVGLLCPISGLLLCRQHLRALEHHQSHLTTYMNLQRDFMLGEYLTRISTAPAGLLDGRAGLALTVTWAAMAGYLGADFQLDHYLRQCFKNDAEDLGLLAGIAGQGIAQLQVAPFMGTAAATLQLDHYVNLLVLAQRPDGDWPARLAAGAEKCTPFLFEGTAGILYFLLLAHQRVPSQVLAAAITRGLLALEKTLTPEPRHWWKKAPEPHGMNPTLGYGLAGIASVFLLAFQVLKVERYKALAVSALSMIPAYPVTADLTLATGLSGIGMVYLQAAALQMEEFRRRAGWIAGVLDHTYRWVDEDTLYWNTRVEDKFDGTLLTGCPGLILFLLKYLDLTEHKLE